MIRQADLFDTYYLSFRRKHVYIKPRGLGKGRYGKWVWQIEYYIMLDGKPIVNPITGNVDIMPNRVTAMTKIRELNNGANKIGECKNGCAAAGGIQGKEIIEGRKDQ